jgi:hypothetical protein
MSRKHHLKGLRISWLGEDHDILEFVVNVAFTFSPFKLSQQEAGELIIRTFPRRLRRSGWWAPGLEYNRVCRKLGIGPQDGKGPTEIPAHTRAIEAILRRKAPDWRFRHRP